MINWWCLLTGLLLIFPANGVTYHNRTGSAELDWSDDPYLYEAEQTCKAGIISGCLVSKAASCVSDLFQRKSYEIGEEARFIKTPPVTNEKIKFEGLEYDSTPRSNQNFFQSTLSFISRRAEHFLKTTGLEIDLTQDLTGNGKYAPRFIDEIYTELDTFEHKNETPNNKYEFKKLFIPLLFMLKMFKVKLLVLLPIILGLASFKKFLGFLAIIVPGIIGYYKVCKPDLYSYGSHGHSSFYHRPPGHNRIGSNHLSFREQQEQAMQLAYSGHKHF